jgi:cobalt/nickel transport system ATP-binding protein
MTGDKKTNRGSIAIRGVSYSYPGRIPALDSVSFEVSPGEKVGLIGPNGAGKSTLLLCLPGLIEGFSGVIEIDGITVDHGDNLKELRRRVGLVFQDNDDQLFNPTIIEDVAFGPLNLGLVREEALHKAKSALIKVDLPEPLYSRPPHRVSGGQKRRAAIAGILAMEPSVLLLDEPTSDLDPRGINNLARLLNALPQTMIIASHNLEFVLLTCSRVIVLDEGKIVAGGDPREVMADRVFMESHGLEKPHSLVPHEHQDNYK